MGKFDLGDEAIITAMNNIFPVEHFCACSIHPPPPCWLTYSLTHTHTHQFPVGPSSGLWSTFSFSPDDLHISNDTTVLIENLLNLLLTNHPTFVTFQDVRKKKKTSGSPAAGERWEKDICNNVKRVKKRRGCQGNSCGQEQVDVKRQERQEMGKKVSDTYKWGREEFLARPRGGKKVAVLSKIWIKVWKNLKGCARWGMDEQAESGSVAV